MSENEARKLISAAQQAHAVQKETERQDADARRRRRQAIRDAMDAGIPRQRLADELGLHRQSLYRILSADE